MVAKLFASVGPDVAFFGQKDAQQVTKQMARDLDFPVEIAVLPTVREPDGLALSSRNAYLGRADRRRAAALHRALAAAEGAVGAGTTSPPRCSPRRGPSSRRRASSRLPRGADPDGFQPVESFNGRPALVAVAARVGPARLIDNVVIGEPAGTHRRRSEGGSDDSAHRTTDREP